MEHFVGTKTLFVLERSIIPPQNYKPDRTLRAELGFGFGPNLRNVSGRIRAQNAELY